MSTKAIVKPARALIGVISVAILVTATMLITTVAAKSNSFTDGDLIYFITSEGSGTTPGTVTATFNEGIGPETVSSVTVPGTVNHGNGSYLVTRFTDSAFAGCTSLESLDISACTALTYMGYDSFNDCKKLKSITIPCNFDKSLFENTGVVPNGDSFKIEYTVMSAGEVITPTTITVMTGGTFTYVHDWKANSQNFAQHKCTRCSAQGSHSWQPDKDNAKQHKCTVCQYTEAHYGGTATCKGQAKCIACDAEYKTAIPGNHLWGLVPDTIGDVSAEYKCATCKSVEDQPIGVNDNVVMFNGQKLKTILQDPYKVLSDDAVLKTTVIEPGSERHNELLTQLDDTHSVEHIAFFELDLYNARGEEISGAIAGKVRVLIQIPDGWDKEDLEAILVMAGNDVEFEESEIAIGGIEYLAFWTNHFSPYALIDVKTEKDSGSASNNGTASNTSIDAGRTSPVTGVSDFLLESVFAFAAAAAVIVAYAVYKRKSRNIE